MKLISLSQLKKGIMVLFNILELLPSKSIYHLLVHFPWSCPLMVAKTPFPRPIQRLLCPNTLCSRVTRRISSSRLPSLLINSGSNTLPPMPLIGLESSTKCAENKKLKMESGLKVKKNTTKKQQDLINCHHSK